MIHLPLLRPSAENTMLGHVRLSKQNGAVLSGETLYSIGLQPSIRSRAIARGVRLEINRRFAIAQVL